MTRFYEADVFIGHEHLGVEALLRNNRKDAVPSINNTLHSGLWIKNNPGNRGQNILVLQLQFSLAEAVSHLIDGFAALQLHILSTEPQPALLFLQIAGLFLGKAILLGLAASVTGALLGTWLGLQFGPELFPVTKNAIKPNWNLVSQLAVAMPVFAALVAFIPTTLAVSQDPAASLRED